jgi:hypothetical protein
LEKLISVENVRSISFVEKDYNIPFSIEDTTISSFV